MDTLHHDAPDMPRFADGMLDLRELGRTLIETPVNEVMSAQADMLCEGGNSRNGYRERRLTTSVGEITMRIPRLRTGPCFPDDMIERHSRTDRAVAAAVAEMYTNGVSTRKIGRIAAKPGAGPMGASQVSRICEVLDAEVAELRNRTFPDLRFPCLWLDATYVKCRQDGHVASAAAVTAIGVAHEGYKMMLGIDCVDTESYGSWKAFLGSLRTRGADSVACVTPDAHEGLRRAIEEALPGAAWQRCIVHLERNVCSCLKTRYRRAQAGRVLHAVFAEQDPAMVRELYHLAIDGTAKMNEQAAAILEEAEPGGLTCLDFPEEHRRRIRTDNAQERCNRETRRRSRVARAFPSVASLIRLVGAVCAEIDEDWSTRRCFQPSSLAQPSEGKIVTTPKEPDPELKEKATRIIQVAMESAKNSRRRVA